MMSVLTREQRYEMLCSIKRTMGTDKAPPHWPKSLTAEEEQFIQDYALQKLQAALSDPEVMAVFKRMKDR
jgi:hypothetical protein